MFTSKQFCLAAALAVQLTWASNLLMFDDDLDDPEEAKWENDDADMTEAEIEEDNRRMLGTTNPERRGYFVGRNTDSGYAAMTRQDKMSALWDQLVPNENNHDVEPNAYWYGKFPQFFTDRAQVSFCSNSDELRRNRNKTTHTQGLVAKVAWIPTQEAKDEGYTGMMQTGNEHVVMRLSETNNLDENGSKGLLPSMALKFLRDNDMSYNMFAMPSFLTTDSWDFFKYPLSNAVEPFDETTHPIETATFLKKITEANSRPFGTAISDIARCNLDGTTVEDVKTPYRLQFKGQVNFDHEKEYDGDRWVWWHEQLQRIPKDTVIYEVFGWTAPEALDGELIKIADIKLLTDLYTSDFGDNRLFFRHQSIAKDRKHWPRAWRRLREDPFINRKNEENIWGNEVRDTWPADEEDAKAMYDAQVAEFGCPFQWLIADAATR